MQSIHAFLWLDEGADISADHAVPEPNLKRLVVHGQARQGLLGLHAHYLLHMHFKGTFSYPAENE